MLAKRFRKNLKKNRAQKGWSQFELSRASGISSSHIKNLELGLKSPTLRMVEKIARALKVCPRTLFHD